ncbi:hypothetical protein [Planctobacterium marinum]|uniref:hypothetical protein n=1 Tax=Planctobacterium marinum TaxID=1631968 RepID=UPI001E4AD924|nr:hypothetical protein [Planctobacterium marinum]MCC2606573.1 hypothetical protein [Planctobacterium marinum]
MEKYNFILNYIANDQDDADAILNFNDVLALIKGHIEGMPESGLRESAVKQAELHFRLEELLQNYPDMKIKELEGYFELPVNSTHKYYDDRILARLRRIMIIFDMCYELVKIESSVMNHLQCSDRETFNKIQEARHIFMGGRKFLGDYFQ